MKEKSILYFVAVLAPLVFSFAFALDIYIPSVPSLVGVFHTTEALVQLTLSLYMLMMGVGQLLVGPLSDRFGRKPVALCSAVTFLLASLAIVFVGNILAMIVLRMLQAFGACGMMVVAFAMVRDCYSDAMSAKVLSYLNSTIAVSPLFAPVLGGYIAKTLGWRACFAVLACLGSLCVLSVLWLQQETHATHQRVAFNLQVFRRYGQLLASSRVWPYALAAGCGIAMFFCFFSISPFIIITLLKVSTTHFGYYFAVLGVAFLFGSMLSARLVAVIAPRRLIALGAMMALVAGVVMYLLELRFGMSLAEFLLPTLLAGVGASFIAGNAAALILEPYPEYAGTAAAILGSCQFASASVAASIMLHQRVVSTNPYAITLIVLATLTLVAMFVAQLMLARNNKIT